MGNVSQRFEGIAPNVQRFGTPPFKMGVCGAAAFQRCAKGPECSALRPTGECEGLRDNAFQETVGGLGGSAPRVYVGSGNASRLRLIESTSNRGRSLIANIEKS